jgi:starch-binding outer membrane protein, SusD/RagB family
MKFRLTRILFVLILLSGCEDYLDESPDKEILTQEDVFSIYENYRRFADEMYDKIYDEMRAIDGFMKNYSSSHVRSDEAHPGRQRGDSYNHYHNGNYLSLWSATAEGSGTHELRYSWNYSWEGIRIANMTIANIDNLLDANQEQKNQLLGQAFALRALFHFELVKRWGGMPYIDEVLSLEENFERERLSYHESILKIVEDCDRAFELLPQQWDNANIGRVTKGMPLALKSRALLYDASPTYNQGNDPSRWEKAAGAAWEIIEYAESTGIYELIDASEAITMDVDNVNGSDYAKGTIEELKNYREIFYGNPINKETIFNRYRGPLSTSNRTMVSPRYMWPPNDIGGTSHTICVSPLQNLVDRYEMNNGWPIDAPESGYNLQNPYVARDPRFYNNILFNKVVWAPALDRGFTSLELYDGAKYRNFANTDQGSSTGYLVRKYWPEDFMRSNIYDVQQPYIFFRLAEMYLNYAEAVNEFAGSTGTVSGSSLTALEAINRIRNRVGMPGVHKRFTADKASFRERIWNERSVELCFEGHRWWDLRRWHIGDLPENRTPRTMHMYPESDLNTYPTGYRFEIKSDQFPARVYEEKHYLYPLQLSDVSMFEGFYQNPGW